MKSVFFKSNINALLSASLESNTLPPAYNKGTFDGTQVQVDEVPNWRKLEKHLRFKMSSWLNDILIR